MVSIATIRLIGIGLQAFSMLFMAIVVASMKWNDILHIGRAVNTLTEKVGELSERVAKIEGILTRIKNSRR